MTQAEWQIIHLNPYDFTTEALIYPKLGMTVDHRLIISVLFKCVTLFSKEIISKKQNLHQLTFVYNSNKSKTVNRFIHIAPFYRNKKTSVLWLILFFITEYVRIHVLSGNFS